MVRSVRWSIWRVGLAAAGLGLWLLLGSSLAQPPPPGGSAPTAGTKTAPGEHKAVEPHLRKAGLEEAGGARFPEDQGARPRVVLAGYTRPGNPPDVLTEKGKIKHVAFEPDFQGIGGTVYFLVLEWTGASETDPWNTGVPQFLSKFVEGLDYDNTHSPPLDTRARYLYLYQVVNDRGMEPLPIRPAANVEVGVVPLASATLRLRVDPRYITSWGYFEGVGFVLPAQDVTLTGERPAGLADEEREKIIAVSATPPIIELLPERRFRFRSPAYPLSNLRMLGSATQNLKGLAAIAELQKKQAAKIQLASWAGNLLQASRSAIRPDEVRLGIVPADYWTRVLQAEAALGEEPEARPATLPGVEAAAPAGRQEVVFQANWFRTARTDHLLKMGQHSVIFGFTTDLPPIYEPIALADPENSTQPGGGGGGIRPAAQAPAAGAAPGVAPGTAPSPAPVAPVVAAVPGVPGGIGAGLLGGLPPLAGFGGGLPGGGGGTGFGAIPPPAAVTASGGGFPSRAASNAPSAATTTGTNLADLLTQLLNRLSNISPNSINIALNNINNQQQSQQQKQFQFQQQQQQQVNGDGQVVPEPAALFLGLLGLPVFLFYCWRRRPVLTAPKE
jgi:hypothetical protein